MPIQILNTCICGRQAHLIKSKGNLYIAKCPKRNPCIELTEPKPIEQTIEDWNKITNSCAVKIMAEMGD